MAFELKIGQGTLHKTAEKKNENSPDYFGEVNIDGVIYKLSGWLKLSARGKWISLAAEIPKPKAALETPRKPVPERQPIEPDDDVPF